MINVQVQGKFLQCLIIGFIVNVESLEKKRIYGAKRAVNKSNSKMNIRKMIYYPYKNESEEQTIIY